MTAAALACTAGLKHSRGWTTLPLKDPTEISSILMSLCFVSVYSDVLSWSGCHMAKLRLHITDEDFHCFAGTRIQQDEVTASPEAPATSSIGGTPDQNVAPEHVCQVDFRAFQGRDLCVLGTESSVS